MTDFHWRARAVSESGARSEWVEYEGNVGADFTARVVPLFTQVQSDFPSRLPEEEWAGKVYAQGSANTHGSCGLTIGECGCAITAAVMLSQYLDIRSSVNSLNITPLTLDRWLVANDGYTSDGGIRWSKVDAYTSNKLVFQELYNPPKGTQYSTYETTSAEFSKVDQSLEQTDSIPVIGRSWWERGRGGIKRTHFFVIDSKLASREYSVRDPYWYQTKTLADSSVPHLVRNYEGGFDGLRIYKRGNGGMAYTPSVTHVLGSPAELLLTDKEGRKVGFDPRTNQVFSEIPGAYYYEEGIDNPDESIADPINRHIEKILVVPNLASGKYDLEVIGTGEGTYYLETSYQDISGESTTTLVHGTTSIDEIDLFVGQFDPDQFENSVIEEDIVEVLLPEELFVTLKSYIQTAEIQPRFLKLRILGTVRLAEYFFEQGYANYSRLVLKNLKQLVSRREDSGVSNEAVDYINSIISQLLALLP